MDQNQKTAEFQQYFSALPLNVQETIQQSSVEIQTVDELRRLAHKKEKAFLFYWEGFL